MVRHVATPETRSPQGQNKKVEAAAVTRPIDPRSTPEAREHMRLAALRRWAAPGAREAASEQQVGKHPWTPGRQQQAAAYWTPERREQEAQRQAAYWTPEQRERQAAQMRRYWTPERRNQQRERTAELWTPERRARVASRWTPERRERAAERSRAQWRARNPEKAAIRDRIAARAQPEPCGKCGTSPAVLIVIDYEAETYLWQCRACIEAFREARRAARRVAS